MKTYYDTGVVLKLYTVEKESGIVRRHVEERNVPLYLNSLHRTECTAALRLKVFRGECDEITASKAIADLADDMESRVIKIKEPDWAEVWITCRGLLDRFASTTGCRTLDALHVASARVLGIREFVTTDHRQRKLAKLAGLTVPKL